MHSGRPEGRYREHALSFIGDVRHKGHLIVLGGLAHGVAIAVFALCGWFPGALLLLALTGAADIAVGATRNTILQLFARGPMLGRVMSMHAMATRGLGPLGGFEAGALASLLGVQHAVALGASVCIIATVVLTWRVPRCIGWARRRKRGALLRRR